jgi:hypothetical protein
LETRILWLGVGLLALFWATRVLNIARFPFFIDEGLHVYFSEVTMQRHPFIYANKYYLFSIWWWSLFAVPLAAPVWLARTVTLLAILPGVAAVVGLGRLMAGVWGAALAGLLYVFSTYHTFFERLAMADPISASAVLVGIYFAYRLSRRVSIWDAVLCGIAIFLAVGAKLSAVPYLGIPIAAFMTLQPQSMPAWGARVRWLVAALATEGVLFGALVVGLSIATGNPFANASEHVGLGDTGMLGVLGRIPGSAGYMLENLQGFVGVGGLVMLALVLVGLVAFRRYFLLLCLIPPTLVFLLSEIQGSRYYAAPVSVMLLCAAVVVGELMRRYGRTAQTVGLAAVFAWGMVAWLPFASTMNNDPLHVPLPARDYREYVMGDSSGFGLDTVRDTLLAEHPVRVIGIMANCQALRYEAMGDFPVECPRINPNGDTIPELAQLMDDSRAEGVYVVLEAIDYLPDRAPGTLLAAIDDPSGRPRLTLYNLAP